MESFFKRVPRTYLVTFLLVVFVAAGLFVYTQTRPSAEYPEVIALSSEEARTFEELTEYFKNLARDKGAAYAFEVLRRAEFPLGTDMHLLGHEVGYALYDEKGIDGIASCTDEFRNACSHSLVISAFIEHGESALPTISKACKRAPGGKGAYTMCFHGLGHGVLAYVGYDLEKAIMLCKKAGTKEYAQGEYVECVGGTVMEMLSGVHDRTAWGLQAEKYLKKDDPLFPCTADFMSREVRPVCLAHITPNLFLAAGLNLASLDPAGYPRAFRFCEALPKSASVERESCYGGFGKEFITLARERDIRDLGSMGPTELRKVREWCNAAEHVQGKKWCENYALASLFWGGESEADASFAFCELAQGSERNECFRQLGGHIGYYLEGTARGTALCLRLPEYVQNLCGL